MRVRYFGSLSSARFMFQFGTCRLGDSFIRFILIIVTILFVATPAAADWTTIGPATPKQRTASAFDASAIEGDIADDGQVAIEIAGRRLLLALQERDIYGERGREIHAIDENGLLSNVGVVTARNFVGVVVGEANGAAFITTDASLNAIYGTIFVAGTAYDLTTETNLLGVRELASYRSNSPRSATEASQCSNLPLKTAQVRVSADQRYRAAHIDWDIRISSAFNEAHGMWECDTNIRQTVGPFEEISNFYPSTDSCFEMLDKFRLHTGAEITIGYYTEDTFVLFTGANMANDGCAYAIPPPGIIEMRKEFSTSVIESVDHVDDSEQAIFGICVRRTWNVMAMGQNPDAMEFWFKGQSQEKIRTEAYPQL